VFISGGLGQDGQILTVLFKKKKNNLNIFYKGKKPKTTKGVNFIRENLLNKKKLDLFFKKKKQEKILNLKANKLFYY